MKIIPVGAAVAAFLLHSPAAAATILVLTDPVTLERRTVVVDPNGPDRAFLCMLPPSAAGCRPIAIRRSKA